MTNSSGPGVCAICAGGRREVVQTQSLALLDRDEACVINFAICHDCGHIQQWPPVSAELMRHHYGTLAAYELHGDHQQLRAAPPSRHAWRFLSLARDVGLTPGRAYEVGCASGEMLNQFRRDGWQVRGCDLSPSAISQAEAIFDIGVDLGGEEETLPHQRDLDLILICHVLEHVYDPAATLRRCHEALAPDGYLLFEVPCATAPELLPPGWFTFEHLHYYQPAILERLLLQAGFMPVELRIKRIAEQYPVIAVAARKSVAGQAQGTADPKAAIAMVRQYTARDMEFWTRTAQKLAGLEGPVFVYGAGIHTAQLLDHTGLERKVEILAIADRDSKKWGRRLAGKPVIAPDALFDDTSDAPVIVSSYGSEGAIVRALVEAGIAASRIRPLYSAIDRAG